MIKVCSEHIDLAIDIVVDEHEIAPEINKIPEEERLSTTCEYCKNNAIYVVANTYSDTICG